MNQNIPVHPSEITPEHIFLSRRKFLELAGTAAMGVALAACLPQEKTSAPRPNLPETATPVPTLNPVTGTSTDEMGNPLTPDTRATRFNNFYEFTTDKIDVAQLASDFSTTPWNVSVDGLVQKPMTFSIEELLKNFDQEERIYRLRCVETWSMVVPWLGFPLAKLLREVEPSPEARYVQFTTLQRPQEMPGQNDTSFSWPYQEGLRLDEAQHNLTILSTGMYGKSLPPQNGGPLRLVVPWKYGFKSIKSIVKITLTAEQPATFWSSLAPDEYGFYANVNPDKPHPRWSQAHETRLGENAQRPTLMFNGYDEVASLYQGMDLDINY